MSAIIDWSKFLLSLAVENPGYTNAIRKIVPDITFKTTLDDTLDLTHTGFKEGGSKIAMLKRYYYNEESILKAKLALEVIKKKGDFGSVAFSTIGKEKKFTHHQHCIQSISIRHQKDGTLEYTVFYRSAETIKIFNGDMIFLRDVIMPIFGAGKVCFFFSNATLNSMYTPIMFIHDKERWLRGLSLIAKVDPPYLRRMNQWTVRYFSNSLINYSTAERTRKHLEDNLSTKTKKEILSAFKELI